MEFKQNNLNGVTHHKYEFSVIPMNEEETIIFIKESAGKSLKKLRQEFESTLSLPQKNDIHVGRKKIHYTKQLGYHLIVLGLESDNREIHVSIEEDKHKRRKEVKTICGAALKDIKMEAYNFMKAKYLNFSVTFEEFEEYLTSITKL